MSHAFPRLFLDTADRGSAEGLFATGAFYGLTTNPSILARDGATVRDLPAIYSWASAAGAQEVCFQTWGRSAHELADNAARIRDIDEHIVVKVPATREGFTVAASLINDGAPVLITAVYHPSQMVLAQTLGARYIAPYVGRMSDQGLNANAAVGAMQAIAAQSESTQILAASLRSIDDVVTLAAAGVPSFTIATSLATELLENPLTARATEVFEETVEELLKAR